MMRQINDAGLALIKAFEGCTLQSYVDIAGVLTIGYGHTRGVIKGMSCDKAQADAWLLEDLAGAERAVSALVTHPISDNQFAALVAFTYNLGSGNLAKSTLLRRVNAGLFAEASQEFQKWNKARGEVSSGLERRRAAEKALFLKP